MLVRAVLLGLIGCVGFAGAARSQQPTGQQEFDCSRFVRNPDGTWAAKQPLELIGQNGRLRVPTGLPLKRGQEFAGLDIAAQLDQQCR